MAKLGDQYAFTITGIQKLYRLPIAYGNDLSSAHSLRKIIYMNVDNDSVIKMFDRKFIHSWTVTHPFSFTSPVVYDKDAYLLYSVLNNKTVIKWSPDEDTLKEGEKIEFQEPVFSVFPIQGEEPFIILRSFKICQLSYYNEISELLKPKSLEPNMELKWADATLKDSQIQIFCFGYSQESKKFKLHSFKFSKDKSASTSFETDISHESATLKDWCLNKFDSTFITVWSDGSVLRHSTFNDNTRILFSTMQDQSDCLIAVAIIDESHVAIAKTALKQKECCLEIWDFKFAACQVKKVIVKTAAASYVQMSVINSSIYLSCSGDLVSIPFHIEKSTLASVMGKSNKHPSNPLVCCWNKNGELFPLSEENEKNLVENMEIPEYENSKATSKDSIENIANRLRNEGSAFFKYIPEGELVSLLRLAISCKRKDALKEEGTNADIVLNVVISSSFSDVFIMKHLKKMNLDETLIFLDILLCLLKSEANSMPEVCDKPSDLQIFNWTCLIIQSHMETFLFSKDRKTVKLLRKLEKCLSEKMEEYEDFEVIKNFLNLKKDSLPKDNVIRKYCIESLE